LVLTRNPNRTPILMDFRCPNCQKDLTVPDEYAGQLMKCPLCQNTFQAPALPPPVAPSSPPSPQGTYGVITEPAPPAPPPEAPRRKKETPATPPPSVPTGDYVHTRTIWISPRCVPWVAPVVLMLAFLFTFFTWASAGTDLDHIAWGWGFTQGNALTILYLFVLLIAFLASMAITVVRLIPGFKVPGGLQQIWPWRGGLVALFALLGLFFLGMQLFVGFVPNDASADLMARLHTTPFVWLTLLFQFVAVVGALLDFWLEIRGSGRPMPRIDVSW
jgi:hypothetical protein